MRLLLDTCVWGGAVPELREAGFDVIWCGELESGAIVTVEPGRVRVRPADV